MKNKRFDYFLVCFYTIAILGFLFDVFMSGYKNIRIYQVIMIVFWSICLFYKIKEIIEKKNNTEIE
jgi:uncharacterized protein with PQ loop repeat